jgi:hypothetical protein
MAAMRETHGWLTEKKQAEGALGHIGVVLNSPLIRRIYSSIG